jgi:hypothetical protein
MSFIKSGLVYAMGIDGGGTTGYGIIGIERTALLSNEMPPIKHFTHGQVTGSYTQQVLKLRLIAQRYHDPFYTLAIALESFSPRKPIRSEEYLSPVYVNARIQFLVDTRVIKAPLFYQTPSQAMTTATDKRLRRWKLYVAGPDHIKDGTRHAITFIRRCQEDKTLRAEAWPVVTDADTHRIPQLMPKRRT